MNISGKRQPYDSPCIGVCSTTNLGDAVCVGCGRTAEEVIGWNRLTRSERIKINCRPSSIDPGSPNEQIIKAGT